MSYITVFTPAYNRENTLGRLYNSLLIQDYKEFEWIIVDDGSLDNTEELVASWIKQRKINIRYYKQVNGGKHRAINRGLAHASGELFFIVDSDDYLLENSLSLVKKYYQDIKSNDDIIGLVGFRCHPNGQIFGGGLPKKTIDADIFEIHDKYNLKAVDKAKIIKTNEFRKFLFPDIKGENFVAESIIWNRMALNYKYRYIDEAIYVCEYLEHGLSYNSIRNRRKNSRYSCLLYNELMVNPNASIKTKLRAAINYWRFAMCRRNNFFSIFSEANNKFMFLFGFFPGFIMFIKDSIYSETKINKL